MSSREDIARLKEGVGAAVQICNPVGSIASVVPERDTISSNLCFALPEVRF